MYVIQYTKQEKKRQIKELQEKDRQLLTKSSLDIKLLSENEEDTRAATLLQYGTVACEYHL